MRIIGFETLRSGRILVLMRLRWLCGLVDEILVVLERKKMKALCLVNGSSLFGSYRVLWLMGERG